MSTEKTPLTSPNPDFGSVPTIPFHVQDSRRFYSRRRRERQLQCIMFITIVAAFIMALIVTISYSMSHQENIIPDDNVSGAEEQSSNPINLKSTLAFLPLKLTKAKDLSPDELKVAVAAGNAAIIARRLADANTEPLPSPSPSARHQFAVSTVPRADEIAMAGIAEIAATKKIESARSFMGKPTSFGSFLDGGWAPENVCPNNPDTDCCPPYLSKYRTMDGSCNHPLQYGMAFTPYRRTLPPDYADGISAPRVGKFGNPLPSAREISLKVHPPSPSTNPSFSVMLAVFGQFLDHDITATAISRGTNGSSLSCCPNSEHPECFPVKVSSGDPVFDVTGRSCMEFVRSAPAAQCKIGPRQQLNQVSAFIDGSVIYGPGDVKAEELREFSGGRLRMQITPDNRTLLPASTDPNDGCNQELESTRGRYCFATGDPRANENLHLTTMHVLWARQHNRLAAQLGQINPQWNDETLYQESRRIVVAQFQHIAYQEFLPIVLGETEVKRRNLMPLSTGFMQRNDSDVDPTIANHFSAAAFRFAHTLLPGLMRVTDMQKGTFSYVQLHKMLFNPYSLYSQGGVESSITTATSNAIQKTSTHVTSQLTEHLFEDPLGNQTTVPCGLDLVSLNIQRGRDHGLPGYTKWREYCGLGNPLKFEDLKDDMDPEALDAISKLYENVDDVDLYTGALAEIPKGDGLVGPTFMCLVGDQFERLKLGDRYWYELAGQPGSFTEDQLKELKKTTLARLICDTSDGITEVQAQVMRSVNPDNPIISCEDIPEISLNVWKTKMPALTLTESLVPVTDWLSFRAEVNKTINDIVASILDKKPPPGSLPDDWAVFQQNINSTFTDLMNKFSVLHPKTFTNVSLTKNLTIGSGIFDWVGVKEKVNKTVSDIINSIYANKPPPGSLPADWLAFRKKINNSLMDLKTKFKIVHPTLMEIKPVSENSKLADDISMIDWMQLKNDINKTIADMVNSINASMPQPGSSPADWIAFKMKILDSLADAKSKFIPVHPKPFLLLKAKKITKGDTFDWIDFKNQLNNTLTDIISSIISKKPPPGSTSADWLTFQTEVNNTFSKFMNQFSDLHPMTVVTEKTSLKETLNDSETKNANKIKDNAMDNANKTIDNAISTVNKTITDIIAELNASKPPSGSPQEDWVLFQKKANEAFAGLYVNKSADFKVKNAKKATVKLTKREVDATFDMETFKENLNESLMDLITLIKTKKPPLNSSASDWLSYKIQVKDSVSKLKDLFSDFKIKELLNIDNIEFTTENDPTFDWVQWKENIDKIVDDLLNDVQLIPVGDNLKWASFRDYLNNSFTDLRNNVATMHVKSMQPKLMVILKEDWLMFKDRINNSIENTLDDVIGHMPAPGDPSWIDYSLYKKSKFAQMQDNLNAIKTDWLQKVEDITDTMIVKQGEFDATNSASSSMTQLLKTGHYSNIAMALLAIIAFIL